MAYPTLTDVKSFLDVTTSDDDARLTLLISWTEELIHRYLGRNLNSATYTQLAYKPQAEIFQLDNYPVDSITSITIDGEVQDLDDYDLVIDVGSVYGDFVESERVSIVYVGGYSTIPPLVVDVFYAVVEDRYNDYKGVSDAEVKDVTLFDFAKVSYDTSTGSGARSINYSGVTSTGNVPAQLQSYLGVIDMYKSNTVLLNGCGVS